MRGRVEVEGRLWNCGCVTLLVSAYADSVQIRTGTCSCLTVLDVDGPRETVADPGGRSFVVDTHKCILA